MELSYLQDLIIVITLETILIVLLWIVLCGKGTHDFWVTYYVISGRDPSDNFAFEDMSVTPRPMRGIVEMENVPRDISDGTIRHQVSTLLQEAGHHWLVPRDLLIKNDAFWPSTSFRPYQMPGREETSLSLEEGSPYYGPPLLGRDNLHWSDFFQSDQSVFDGIPWEHIYDEDGYQIWRARVCDTAICDTRRLELLLN